MGLIFDIRHYAINDGPGIRTTIFVKGCPLSCVWCHNPEGQNPKPQRLYTKSKCIGCKECVDNCPQGVLSLLPTGIVCHHEGCSGCNRCVRTCPTKALELSGKAYSISQLKEIIEKQIPFFDKSGGGVTLCGGEPLMFPSWCMEVAQECKKLGVHCAIDTSLYATTAVVQEALQNADLMLVDLKIMDSSLHKYYTGRPNELILGNFALVADSDIPYIVRIPLIEGVNADNQNIEHSAQFLSSLSRPPLYVELLPYHAIGEQKHFRLGTSYNPQKIPMNPPTPSTLEKAADILKKHQLTVRFSDKQ